MASRGRGRGRGAKRTFNRDQLNALGVVGNEPLSQLSNPPPLFPPLLRSAVPLESGQDLDYALVLKQDFVNYMQLTYAYMKPPVKANDDAQEKLELPDKEVHDWRMFPSELRPKMKAKRKIKVPKKQEDYIQRLNKLEQQGDKSFNIDNVKTEPHAEDDEDVQDEEEEDKEEEEEHMEDDMDDGTDYVNNYFDNGDNYGNDEDDNLDDGPIY